MGVASRDEAEALAQQLLSKFERLRLYVEEGWDDDFYISVISEPGYTPDIKSHLPGGWNILPWSNPDQRSELTMIYKV